MEVKLLWHCGHLLNLVATAEFNAAGDRLAVCSGTIHTKRAKVNTREGLSHKGMHSLAVYHTNSDEMHASVQLMHGQQIVIVTLKVCMSCCSRWCAAARAGM